MYKVTCDDDGEWHFVQHATMKVVLCRTNNKAFAKKIRDALNFEHNQASIMSALENRIVDLTITHRHYVEENARLRERINHLTSG